jgi:hypothetical protein
VCVYVYVSVRVCMNACSWSLHTYSLTHTQYVTKPHTQTHFDTLTYSLSYSHTHTFSTKHTHTHTLFRLSLLMNARMSPIYASLFAQLCCSIKLKTTLALCASPVCVCVCVCVNESVHIYINVYACVCVCACVRMCVCQREGEYVCECS